MHHSMLFSDLDFLWMKIALIFFIIVGTVGNLGVILAVICKYSRTPNTALC